MGLGPGKYDAVCRAARAATDAEAVILVVIDGAQGTDCSVQATPDLMRDLPDLLRRIADGLEADLDG
jgi:hypothetical protein